MRGIVSALVASGLLATPAAWSADPSAATAPGMAAVAESGEAPAHQGPPPLFSLTLPNGTEQRVGNSSPVDTTSRMQQELVGEWRSEPAAETKGILPSVIFVFRPDHTYNEFVDFSGKGTTYSVQIWGTYALWAVSIIGAQLELTPAGVRPDTQCSLWTERCAKFPLERNIVSFVVDVPDHNLITGSAEFKKTSSEPGSISAAPNPAPR